MNDLAIKRFGEREREREREEDGEQHVMFAWNLFTLSPVPTDKERE